MKIAVRMDDITPDMDWESFEACTKMLDAYGIQPLLGIVPDNHDPKLSIMPKDPHFFEKMKELQSRGYCLAMHGCHHVYTTKKGGVFPLNPQSEFAGAEEERQRKLLKEGKRLLEQEGIQTDIFMAPGHTLDRATVRILRELGFRYITDGYGSRPYLRDGMTWLPISFLRRLSFSDRKGFTTIVLHVNRSSSKQLQGLEAMLEQNRDRLISYRTLLEQEPVRQSAVARMAEYALALSKQWAARLLRKLKNR